MEGESHPTPEGTYAELAKRILKGHRFESDSIVAGNVRIGFRPASAGFDIFLDGRRLGNTTDNYFLVYLTELFTDRDQESLERIRRLAGDARTLQATELQQTVARDADGFKIGKQRVTYSRRYFQCSCPDWKYRRRLGGCKHIAALRLLEA